MHLQDPPNAIQIELTEGCNLACYFCGIAGIRNNNAKTLDKKPGTNSKPFKFMTFALAKSIAIQIKNAGWNPRIEMALHGEPTMNPHYLSIVKKFREQLPKASLMMTSNGGGLLEPPGPTFLINRLMKYGLNVLLLDNYISYTIVKKIINKYAGNHKVAYYPEDKTANPHRRRKPNEHIIVIGDDPSKELGGTHGRLSNHCGCAFPPNFTMLRKRCAKPFRELSIRWDGNVAICCNDFRGVYKCGSILSQPINNLWQNKRFASARKALYHGLRDFTPCYGCDERSFRVGLLPDKLGKQSLPEPKRKDWEIIMEASSGEPYTKPVKRPWEEKGNKG